MPDGYGFWWNGNYVASLTTGGSEAINRHDILLHAIGEDTHGHSWVLTPSNGEWAQGVQLKDRGQHILPDGSVRSFTTAPIFRGRLERLDPKNVRFSLAAMNEASVVTALPVVGGRAGSSRNPERVQLDIPSNASWAEIEVAVVPSLVAPGHPTPLQSAVSFGGGSPLGVTVRVRAFG